MSQIEDSININGRVSYKHLHEGELVKEETHHNTITSAGIAEVCKLVGSVGTPVAFDYIAVGDGTTAPATGDTALGGVEISRLQDATPSTSGSTKLIVSVSFTAFTDTVEEAGLFNAATAGDMLARDTAAFSPGVPIGANDTLKVVWSITVS